MDSIYDKIVATLVHVQIVKYMIVVSISVLLYDYFLTLDREITLIWRSKWGIGKILFFLARYPTFVDVPLAMYVILAPQARPATCLSVYVVTTWVITFGVTMSEAILFLRTYALFAGSRKMLVFLLTLFLAVFLSAVVITELFLRSVRFGPSPLPQFIGCYPIAGSKIILSNLVLLMLQEMIIVCLMFYRVVTTIHSLKSPLMQSLFQDGLLYFIYLFLLSIGNVIVVAAGPPELGNLLNIFQRVMHSILSARIMLHIRDAACKDPNTTTLGADKPSRAKTYSHA